MVRIFELNAEHGCFSDRLACVLPVVIDLCLQPLHFEHEPCRIDLPPNPLTA